MPPRLETGNSTLWEATAFYDVENPCGIETNFARYLVAEAGTNICVTAVLTHGGAGNARELRFEGYALIARRHAGVASCRTGPGGARSA
jgi:alkylation response protein AidB-like acyl-CoA dehydrogenase